MTNSEFIESFRRQCSPLDPISTGVTAQLNKLQGIRAVFFDIYGTLLISSSGDIGLNLGAHKRQSLQDVIDLFGSSLNCSAADAIGEFEDAIQTAHKAARAEGIEFPEVDIVEVWRETLAKITNDASSIDYRRFSVEFEIRTNPVWPMPQMSETIDALRDSGLVLGIVSNAQFLTPLIFPALVNRSLNDLGFTSGLSYFSFEHRRAKPGLFLYQLAAQDLATHGISPKQVVYVGNDMLNDIAAAAAVGFRTALFAGDQRSLRWREDDVRTANKIPDIVITALPQLLDCINRT